MSELDYLTFEKDNADAAVIWLHGLGADGHDFYEIVPLLNLSPDLAVRFIFPHAPVQPVTVNMGMAMRSWYDILGIGDEFQDDEAGIRKSAAAINDLIQTQIEAGINSKRIVLAGFSQGGAISLFAGLRYPEPLAGVLALSTYLPRHETLEQEASSANKSISIMMMHGTNDEVVPIALAEKSRNFLIEKSYSVDWITYPMPHSVCPEQCIRIGQWLSEIL